MRRIPLSKGLFALVDDEDFERVGQFKWHVHRNGHTVYAVRRKRVDGKQRTLLMHREILCCDPAFEVDHVDGDGLNNTRENIRPVSKRQNAHNRVTKSAGKSSKYRGVSWDKWTGSWKASIGVDGKMVHVGRFGSEDEAARAYNAAGLKRDPAHFTPNLIEEAS